MVNTTAKYFSEELMDKLRQSEGYPITAFVAPVGYGKTTALRKLLEEQKRPFVWTSLASGPDFWTAFCDGLHQHDPALAKQLIKLGFPDERLRHTSFFKLMRESVIPEGTAFVFDDYHAQAGADTDALLLFWADFLADRYPVMLTTRTKGVESTDELLLHGKVHLITDQSLTFTPKDIRAYFALCGCLVSEQDAQLLYVYSEGWVSQLYLFMLEYAQSGTFSTAVDVTQLLLRTVYNPLPEECKEFLLSLAVTADFTLPQARFIWRRGNESELLHILLGSNAFITYDHIRGTYHFHNIFAKGIRGVFDTLPQERKREIYDTFGQWHAQNGNWPAAMDSFFLAGNFDRLMYAIEQNRNVTLPGTNDQNYARFFAECPPEVRAAHPAALLCYARRLFAMNDYAGMTRVVEEFREVLQLPSWDGDKKWRLMADYEMFLGMAAYNDLAKMDAHHREAAKWTGGKPADTSTRATWTFGNPSVLFMFHRESGNLQKLVDDLKPAMALFYKISDRHGAGAEYAAEAEAAFLRGDIPAAAIALHRAQYLAHEGGQWAIHVAALFIEMRIALFRGDWAQAISELNILREDTELRQEYMLLHTVDLCESWIHCLVGAPEQSADWLRRGDFKSARLFYPARPALYVHYDALLLAAGEYARLIALAQEHLAVTRTLHCLLGEIYLMILLACAEQALGRAEKAALYLDQALKLALPDGILMPFAEFGSYLMSLLAARSDADGRITSILALCATHSASVRRIRGEYFSPNRMGLTQREYEIAALAAQGLSNREISARLFITDNTVKSALKSIFNKLDIHDRRELMLRMK